MYRRRDLPQKTKPKTKKKCILKGKRQKASCVHRLYNPVRSQVSKGGRRNETRSFVENCQIRAGSIAFCQKCFKLFARVIVHVCRGLFSSTIAELRVFRDLQAGIMCPTNSQRGQQDHAVRVRVAKLLRWLRLPVSSQL